MCGIGIICHHDSEFYSSQFLKMSMVESQSELFEIELINKKRFRIQLSLESALGLTAPGLNNFPVIIVFVY